MRHSTSCVPASLNRVNAPLIESMAVPRAALRRDETLCDPVSLPASRARASRAPTKCDLFGLRLAVKMTVDCVKCDKGATGCVFWRCKIKGMPQSNSLQNLSRHSRLFGPGKIVYRTRASARLFARGLAKASVAERAARRSRRGRLREKQLLRQQRGAGAVLGAGVAADAGDEIGPSAQREARRR